MTLFVVGEAPGDPATRAAGGRPFDSRTRSGRRLAELLGVEEVADAYPVLNLVDRWPGRTAHGSAFPRGLARSRADALWFDLPAGDLLLVGKRVAAAFDVSVAYLCWESVTRYRPTGTAEVRYGRRRAVAVFPHPSGVNRWWNEPTNVVAAARFARTLRRRA